MTAVPADHTLIKPVRSHTKPARVFVHGAAGRVGAATAAELLRNQTAGQLVLADTDAERLAVQVMDLELLAGLRGACQIRTGSTADCAASDVIIMAASVPHRDGTARMDFLAENWDILQELLNELPDDWSGNLIITTNPVDPLCTLASHRLPRATVLGYNRNDSLRLGHAIAAEIRCPPFKVTAWAIGEHGPHLVPLFDRTTVEDTPITLTAEQQTLAFDRVQGWYDRWQAHGTGMTSAWVTGAGVADLLSRFLSPEPTMTTASIMAYGSYGLNDVSVGLPVLLGAHRAEPIEWSLHHGQLERLTKAAEVIAAAFMAVSP